MNLNLRIYLVFVFAVFQQCRCNDFENTDSKARQYAEIVISVKDQDDNNSISILDEEKKICTVEHLSQKPWKKVLRFAFHKIDDKNDNVDALGKEQVEKFSFTDSNGKNYDVEIVYEATFRLISPSRMGIAQYRIKNIICDNNSVKLTNKDWLSSSYYEADATIYI